MALPMIVVPVVSLLTPAPSKELVAKAFGSDSPEVAGALAGVAK